MPRTERPKVETHIVKLKATVSETAEPARPTHVLMRCRRCTALHTLESPDAERHLEELVAQNRTTTTVRCDDGALAVAEIIGVGPGAWPPTLPERAAPEVVIKEKGT